MRRMGTLYTAGAAKYISCPDDVRSESLQLRKKLSAIHSGSGGWGGWGEMAWGGVLCVCVCVYIHEGGARSVAN